MMSDESAIPSPNDLDFNARRCPPMRTLIWLCILLFCWHLPIRLFELTYFEKYDANSQMLITVQLILLLISCCSIIGHGLRRFEKQAHSLDPIFKALDYSHCMQLSFCCCFMLASIIALLNQVLHKSVYLEESHFEGVHSHSHSNAPLNPHILFSSFSVATCPLMLGAIYYDALRDVYWLWWLICLGALLASALIMKDVMYGATILYLYSMLAVVFNAIRQNVWVAYLKDQLRQHNQTLAMSAHDTNMKHILANVAHDLKTPLSSLVSGFEVLESLLSEARDHLTHHPDLHQETKGDQHQLALLPTLSSLIDSSLSSLKDASNTNHFMIMTINRCIEYAKASQGLKLVPFLETMNLPEALNLPLRIMREIQGNINIVMLDIPSSVCAYIVSDQQWLQENVLCLLSNAVKYSQSGSVVVRIIHEQDNQESGEAHDRNLDHQANALSSTALLNRSIEGGDNSAVHSHESPDLLQEHDTQTSFTSPRVSGQQTLSSRLLSNFRPRSPFRARRVSAEPPAAEELGQRGLEAAQPPQLEDSSMLRIEVEDQGIGMSEEARSNLFRPFQQQQALAIGSTGLGLFSLRKRVETLGGQCGVSGRRDGTQGSLFWFTIPYEPDHTTAQSMDEEDQLLLSDIPADRRCSSIQTITRSGSSYTLPLAAAAIDDFSPHLGQSSASTTSPTFSSKRRHILLVDDTPSIIKMTTKLLKRENFRVTVATNGAMALDIIRAEQERTGQLVVFDLVLMDLHMPIMDGMEAIKRLRQQEFLDLQNLGSGSSMVDNFPAERLMTSTRHNVLCLSADVNEDTMKLAVDSGFDGCLKKPILITAVLEALARV